MSTTFKRRYDISNGVEPTFLKEPPHKLLFSYCVNVHFGYAKEFLSMLPQRRHKLTAFEVTYPGETQEEPANLDLGCRGNRRRHYGDDYPDPVR